MKTTINNKTLQKITVGVDEVGRGCLAGPVCAAAVYIPPGVEDSQFKDSKTLSSTRRTLLSKDIKLDCIWHIAFASVEEIGRLNILHASLLAMRRAIEGVQQQLPDLPIYALIDGNQKVPGTTVEQLTMIKGDQRSTAIAAASIIAKVERDSLMIELSKEFPKYGFESHKGYSTTAHKQAIAEFGPIHVHRKTFAGVKEFLKP